MAGGRVAQIWPLNNDRVPQAATPGGSNPTEYQGKYGCWSYNRGPRRQVFVAGVENRGPRRRVFVAGVEDSFGNRTLEAFSSAACSNNPTPQIKAVYNSANNQIQSVSGTTSATFIYDASGNTLYDGNNYYWYDAEGARIAKATVFPRYVTAHFAPRFVR